MLYDYFYAYDKSQIPPLSDRCDCDEIRSLIDQGKIDTTPLITHRFTLKDIEKDYDIFENKLDEVIKITIADDKKTIRSERVAFFLSICYNQFDKSRIYAPIMIK